MLLWTIQSFRQSFLSNDPKSNEILVLFLETWLRSHSVPLRYPGTPVAAMDLLYSMAPEIFAYFAADVECIWTCTKCSPCQDQINKDTNDSDDDMHEEEEKVCELTHKETNGGQSEQTVNRCRIKCVSFQTLHNMDWEQFSGPRRRFNEMDTDRLPCSKPRCNGYIHTVEYKVYNDYDHPFVRHWDRGEMKRQEYRWIMQGRLCTYNNVNRNYSIEQEYRQSFAVRGAIWELEPGIYYPFWYAPLCPEWPITDGDPVREWTYLDVRNGRVLKRPYDEADCQYIVSILFDTPQSMCCACDKPLDFTVALNHKCQTHFSHRRCCGEPHYSDPSNTDEWFNNWRGTCPEPDCSERNGHNKVRFPTKSLNTKKNFLTLYPV